MLRAVKSCPSLRLGVLVRALRTSIVFGNRPLIFTEHIDPKSLFRVQVSVSARAVIHTDQHQHGIKRNRRKSVSGHAVHFTIEVDRDDRNPGGKGPHRLPEIGGIQSHSRRGVAGNVSRATSRTAVSKDVASSVSTGIPSRHGQPPTLPRRSVVSFDSAWPFRPSSPPDGIIFRTCWELCVPASRSRAKPHWL